MYDMILYAHEHDKNIPLSPLTIEILKVCLRFISGVNKNFPLTDCLVLYCCDYGGLYWFSPTLEQKYQWTFTFDSTLLTWQTGHLEMFVATEASRFPTKLFYFIFLIFIPFLLSKLFDCRISHNFYDNILFWETPEMESGRHISTYLGMEENWMEKINRRTFIEASPNLQSRPCFMIFN